MSNVLFIDTGYVIALINKNDEHHEKALALAEKYENFRFITTDPILLEIGNALSRIARHEAITIIILPWLLASIAIFFKQVLPSHSQNRILMIGKS